MKKKGQVAIEFLVTYGWAILAAMLVIAALTYFGITNPSLPDKCIFNNAFECGDFRISESAIQVKLTNILGQTIYGNAINNITAVTETGTICDVNGTISPVTYLEPEGQIEITCANTEDFDTGDKQRVKLTVTYTKTPDGYDQVSLGEIYATVQ